MKAQLGEDYKLRNGVVLRPGSRVRVPTELIWSISEADAIAYGIELDHKGASAGSEVLIRRCA